MGRQVHIHDGFSMQAEGEFIISVTVQGTCLRDVRTSQSNRGNGQRWLASLADKDSAGIPVHYMASNARHASNARK